MSAADERAIVIESVGAQLEARLSAPPEASHAMVFCHPHPQYGGDMHNPVVTAITGLLAARGWATLRFNFRGVGASTGNVGDMPGGADDARAALEVLRDAVPSATRHLGGYSYGSMIALQVGLSMDDVASLLVVAPPFAMFSPDALPATDKPVRLIVGDNDEFCDVASFRAAVEKLGHTARAAEVAGADHFWFGREPQLTDAVTRLLDHADG